MAQKPVVFDIDGTEAVSRVLLNLLNDFPGLGSKKILFSTLSESSGLGFFPTSGAALLSDDEDITGHVSQKCLYPFEIVYRLSPKTEEHRIRAKELLDGIGKWLERQPVTVNGKSYQLESYPALSSGNRIIKSINRTNPSHLYSTYQDGIEDWVVSAALRYENNFDR